MKAILNPKYGPPADLRLGEIERPEAGTDGVLVRVRAVSVNPADFHFLRGEPLPARLMMGGVGALRRPKRQVPGIDLAGVVEAVGPDVTDFEPGDEVFGAGAGT